MQYGNSCYTKVFSKWSLTTTAFARALVELGLLNLQTISEDQKIDKTKLLDNRNWSRFYRSLSDYRFESGETFNTLNVLMCFILTTNNPQKEKVEALYDILDWQCKGLVNRKIIRLFIKNFCVVAGELLPYYAGDPPDHPIAFDRLKNLWRWVIEVMPSEITTKIMRERVCITKSDFVSLLKEDEYDFLFNAILLRNYMRVTYEARYKEIKETKRQPRLSVAPSDEESTPIIHIEDKNEDFTTPIKNN